MVATPIQWGRFLFARRKPYLSNEEPSLDEIFNEPIIRLMMDRDGVKLQSLRTTLSEISGRIAERVASPVGQHRRQGEPRPMWF
jgi:hypothetical protein